MCSVCQSKCSLRLVVHLTEYLLPTQQTVILLFLIEDNTSLLVSVPAAFGVLLQVTVMLLMYF
jgi:Cleft lip and palate transmembrane protein 1 (CLPTM1)